MNTDPLPEDLDRLRRLLALKRHETPPPGYFRDFSRQVIRRIEAEEQRSAITGWKAWAHRLRLPGAWLNANAWIASGLAVLAVTAIFLRRNPPPPGAASSTPKAAGLGFSSPDSPAAQPAVQERLQLPAGVGYRIEIIAFDSNAIPHSIYLQPVLPGDQILWPR